MYRGLSIWDRVLLGCLINYVGLWRDERREAEAMRHLRAEGVLTLAAVVQDGAVYFDEALEPDFGL